VSVCSIPAFQRLIFWIAGVTVEDAAAIAPVVEAVQGFFFPVFFLNGGCVGGRCGHW
jgi:hypothetical protein